MFSCSNKTFQDAIPLVFAHGTVLGCNFVGIDDNVAQKVSILPWSPLYKAL